MSSVNSAVKKKGLHIMKIDRGIILDGMKLEGVSSYSIEHKENENTVRLTLKMDVKIL